jgi:fibronectin type 3 domain-containing protein
MATPIAATTFTDSTVLAGQTYFYIVVAVDATGQISPPSNEALVTIPTS